MVDLSDSTVASAFRQYQEAAQMWDEALTAGGEVPTEVVSHVFACANHVLRAYCLPSNWIDEEKPKEALPLPLAYAIAEQIRYIVAGKCPEPIAQLTGRGTPGIGPQEDRDRGIAVAYLKLVEQGLIADPAPTKTVAMAYKLDDRSVRRWRQKLSHIEPEYFFPSSTPEKRAEHVVEEFKRAAIRYRAYGRGAQGRADRHRQDGPK